MRILEVNDTVGCAFMILGGLLGNGEERKKKVTEMGLDYSKVQSCVNDLLPIVRKYGE